MSSEHLNNQLEGLNVKLNFIKDKSPIGMTPALLVSNYVLPSIIILIRPPPSQFDSTKCNEAERFYIYIHSFPQSSAIIRNTKQSVQAT